MILWIFAIGLMAVLGLLGYYQGAIRVAFSFVGLLAAALAAVLARAADRGSRGPAPAAARFAANALPLRGGHPGSPAPVYQVRTPAPPGCEVATGTRESWYAPFMILAGGAKFWRADRHGF